MCKKGKHDFLLVTDKVFFKGSRNGEEHDATVLWCRICGSIHVDRREDGKINSKELGPKINGKTRKGGYLF